MEVNYLEEIIVEFWGDMACFTAPYGKVERLTYPFPTPSAVRGMLSAIYSKPNEFYWQVNRIEVLKPIQYISFKRNEVKSTVNDKPIYTDEDHTPRQTVALKDVRYRVYASIVAREAFIEKSKQLYEQARRRISSGKCFMQPALGLRECVAYFELYDPATHTDKPIDADLDVGLMVYDIFDLHDYEVRKKVCTKLTLFHAVMNHGVIQIPSYDSPEVLKGG
jgi:CRISPR-associated protein Cas5d